MYNIVSADGRKFHVGSECVRKTADAKLVKEVDEAARAVARAKRHSKDATVKAELAALMSNEALRAKLAGQPHSNAWRRAQGDTKLDEVEFALARCGAAGRARYLRRLRKESA